MKRLTLLVAALLVNLLTGCESNPTNGDTASVEQAMSSQTAKTDDRQRAKVHTELGRLYFRNGRFDVALEEAKNAVEAENAYAPAHDLMGLIYMALRKNDLSEQAFRRAISLGNSDPEINNDLGWFLCQTGRARESMRHFAIAINNPLYQSPGNALTNAGLCSLLLKEDRQAEEYLLRALRIDKGNANALFWLGDIAYRGNRLEDARQRLKDLHALLEPTAESAWLALRIDRKLGDREGEAHYTGIMRRKYRDSSEYLKLSRGEFD